MYTIYVCQGRCKWRAYENSASCTVCVGELLHVLFLFTLVYIMPLFMNTLPGSLSISSLLHRSVSSTLSFA